jgi:hypothetical protein
MNKIMEGSFFKTMRKCSVIWVMIALASLVGAPSHSEVKDQSKELSKDPLGIEEKWGVKVLYIKQSAGGYMLDFRYKVTDAEKASPLFDRKIKPYLIDQASGAKFLVPESPKVGALRQTRKPVAEKNYFIIFANPGKYIKNGNKVTVVIGDFKAENLTVQ